MEQSSEDTGHLALRLISERQKTNKRILKVAKACCMEGDGSLRHKEEKEPPPAGLCDLGDGAQSGGTAG